MVAFTSPPRSPRAHRSPRLAAAVTISPRLAAAVTISPRLTAAVTISPTSSFSSSGATYGGTQAGDPAPLTLGEFFGLTTPDDAGEAPPPLRTPTPAREALGDWPAIEQAALVHGDIPSKQKFSNAVAKTATVKDEVDQDVVVKNNDVLVENDFSQSQTRGSSLTITSPGGVPSATLSSSLPSAPTYAPTLEVDGFEFLPGPSTQSVDNDSWLQPKNPIRKASIRTPSSLDRIRASPPPAVARALAQNQGDLVVNNVSLPVENLGLEALEPLQSLTTQPLPTSLSPTATPPQPTFPLLDCDGLGEQLNNILSPPRQAGKRGRTAPTAPGTPSSSHAQKKVKVESPTSTANTSLLWQYVTTPTSSTIAALPLDTAGNVQTEADHVPYEAQTAVGLCLNEMGDTVYQSFVVDGYHQLPNQSPDVNPSQKSESAARSVKSKTRVRTKLASVVTVPDSPSPAPRKIGTLDTTTLRDGKFSEKEDIVMRSPSPTVTDLLNDRLPASAKGKQRANPTPSRTKDDVDEWTIHPRTTNSLATRLLSPNASSASIFPPQSAPTLGNRQYRTPAPASRVTQQHELFESNPTSRGPAISSTILAERFPLRESLSPHPTLRPPSPYLEDGEIPDPIAGRSNLLDFVQQQAENAPAEQDDFLTYLPPPIGGFPRVHFTTPTGAFENIEDAQLLDWERERCNGLIALGISFGGHGALDGDVDPRYRQLISYATHLLNARFHTDRIAIAQPRPKSRVANLNAAPHTALLYGITADEAELLEEEGVMCTPRLAMFFHKLDVIFPSYIGAIHGLTTRVIEPVYDMVMNHFLSPEAERLFSSLARRYTNPVVEPDFSQAYHLNTMYVRRLDCRAKGNTHTPVFLVYMRSPASDYHSHRLWTAFCKKINLSHSLYGTGHLRSPGVCALCHGHDHPTGLCRFPSIEGWNAPPPYQPPNFSIPLPVTSRDASRTSKQAGSRAQNKNKKRRNATQSNPSTPR